MYNIDEKIQASLLNLMKEKPLDKITIISIADNSNVDRTSVYQKYRDKFTILQVIEDNILNGLDNTTEDTYQLESQKFVSETQILRILEAVNENRETISILLSENGDPRFYEYFVKFLVDKGLKIIDNDPQFNGLDARQKELLVQYLSSALLGLVKYWLLHPEMSAGELNNFFENLFRNGINSFTEQ